MRRVGRWVSFGALVFAASVCPPARLFGLDPNTPLAALGRQTWHTENGLPQNTVHSVLQTHDGYIWLATEGGLVRFDGTKFTVFDTQNTPAIRSNNIRGILEDRYGNLWIATPDGLTRRTGSTFTTFTAAEGLPGNNSLAIYQDPSGGAWILTSEGLARYQKGYFARYDHDLSDATGAIAHDGSGALWIGMRDGVKLFLRGRFFDPPAELKVPKNSVDALLFASGVMWMGTRGGLTAVDLEHNRKALGYSFSRDLPGKRIVSLAQDKTGAIWVGTDAGAARISQETVQRFPPYDQLSESAVLAIKEDREGDVWLGTESDGVTLLRDRKFTSYTAREGVTDNMVRCVFQDRHRVVWVGTDGEGLRRYQGGEFTSLTTRDGLSSNVILALGEDSHGNLLVGTPDGLNIIRRGGISVWTSADGLPDDFIRSIYRDGDGSLWIGTRRGLSHFERGRFTTFTEANGLGSDLVGSLLRDSHHVLWVGTFNGLSCFDKGKFTTYRRKNGLSGNIITAVIEDGNGSMWIGTQNGGLDRYRDGKFTPFPASLHLPEEIFGLVDDADQNLWISAKTGIFRVSENDLNRFADTGSGAVTVVPYGTSDGLRVSECSGGGHPAVWRGANDALWFATLKGVAVLPSPTTLNTLPPPVSIESVSLDDKVLNADAVSEIPPGHTRIAFEYTALSFVAPQKVRYRYKLEGFDPNWIDAGTSRVASYTNLSPKSYRFHVIARNNDGIWNESGASLAFSLLPSFYQTYWFEGLMAAVLALVVFAFYRWRVRQVETQFDAVLRERNRIAREIHDTLAQGFVGVSVQLEIVSRVLSSSRQSAKDHLDQARILVRSSLSEARRAIWDLRSQSVEQQDLAARVSKMANQVVGSNPIKVKLQVHGAYRPLAAKVEYELLKISQEAVTNAVRHSSAENIDIELEFDAKRVRLVVVDDGCGFLHTLNGRVTEGHYGLQGMRERAEQIDAELNVHSAPGEGTKISVEAPVN